MSLARDSASFCQYEPVDPQTLRCGRCGHEWGGLPDGVKPQRMCRPGRSINSTCVQKSDPPDQRNAGIQDTAADCIHRGDEKDTAKCKPCQNGGASTTKVYHCRKLDIDVSPGLVTLDGQRLHRCWLDCDFYTPAQTPGTANTTAETANEGDGQRPADQPEGRNGGRDRREDVPLRGAGPAGEAAAGSQHLGDGETAGTKTAAV